MIEDRGTLGIVWKRDDTPRTDWAGDRSKEGFTGKVSEHIYLTRQRGMK